MRLLCFGVYDEKAGAFGHPFFSSAMGLAIRQFGDWINNPETNLAKHPQDYRLLHLGEFDDVSGVLTALAVPALMCTGMDHVPAAEGLRSVKVR